MSVGLPAIQIIDFDAQVKAAYQKAGLLRAHVRTKLGVVGASTRFRRYNRGVATRRIPQTDVTPMNTGYAEVTATLEDWNAPEYTDVFDQQKTNISEREVVAVNIASAIGRREDQIIIDALNAVNASANIAAGSTGMTYDKMRRAAAIFDARAVPMGQRKMTISPRGKEDILGDNRFISMDFISKKLVESGELPPRLMGFDLVMIEDRAEGGLPLASTTRTNFAWDMQALGLAIGLDQTTAVDWIPEKTSWLANKLFSAGAVGIDPDGVIEIDTVEA
jgi:hypothetical protein